MKQEIISLKKKQNELVSRKHKTIFTILNYIEHFLILASIITGCISISAFASLLSIPIEITISAIGLQICAIAEGLKIVNELTKRKRNMTK